MEEKVNNLQKEFLEERNEIDKKLDLIKLFPDLRRQKMDGNEIFVSDAIKSEEDNSKLQMNIITLRYTDGHEFIPFEIINDTKIYSTENISTAYILEGNEYDNMRSAINVISEFKRNSVSIAVIQFFMNAFINNYVANEGIRFKYAKFGRMLEYALTKRNANSTVQLENSLLYEFCVIKDKMAIISKYHNLYEISGIEENCKSLVSEDINKVSSNIEFEGVSCGSEDIVRLFIQDGLNRVYSPTTILVASTVNGIFHSLSVESIAQKIIDANFSSALTEELHKHRTGEAIHAKKLILNEQEINGTLGI